MNLDSVWIHLIMSDSRNQRRGRGGMRRDQLPAFEELIENLVSTRDEIDESAHLLESSDDLSMASFERDVSSASVSGRGVSFAGGPGERLPGQFYTAGYRASRQSSQLTRPAAATPMAQPTVAPCSDHTGAITAPVLFSAERAVSLADARVHTRTDELSRAVTTTSGERGRGKRNRTSGELDRHPTKTYGPAAPLPPPDHFESSDEWFKPAMLTESIPDLSALAGDSGRSFDGESVEAYLGSESVLPTEQLPTVSGRLRFPWLRIPDLQANPWMFSALLAATCLAVGMVIGALLFSHGPNEAATESQPRADAAGLVQCIDAP